MTSPQFKIELSVQPKNTFNKRCVVWVISVAPETARRLHAVKLRSIELADCPKRVHRGARRKARRQRTGPIFIYTLHRHELVHRGFEPSVPGYGGARRNGRRAMRPMPPSRSSERRSFAPPSSTSDLQHRDLSGGSDRSAKISGREGFFDQGGNFPDCRFKFPARPQKIPCSGA